MPTLPAYVSILAAGYAEQPEATVARTEMESGPPKQARVRSTGMVRRPVNLRIDSNANYLLWVIWVRDTLAGGSLWFDYSDPVTGSTKTARIVNGQYDASPGSGVAQWTIKTSFETWG